MVARLYFFTTESAGDTERKKCDFIKTHGISGLPPGKYKLETGDPDTEEEAEATVAAGSSGVTLRLQKKKEGE